LLDRELGLTMELVMGVIRHRLTLARILEKISGKPRDKINPRHQDILMLGAYQIIWLDGIPDFAAVDEAVRQAKSDGSLRPGRFVNAVLRKLLRLIDTRRIPRSQSDAVRAVPVDGQEYCQFQVPIFTDPTESPVEYLAEATSNPRWLVSRWVSNFGMDKTVEICMTGICRPPVFLRPNRLRTDLAGLIERLNQEGYEPDPTADGSALAVMRAAGLTNSSAFAEGLFQPQDPTASSPVKAMNLLPGQTVVDLCAGLGTKTTQMAEILRNEGRIIACDRAAEKLPMLQVNCKRLGITNVRIVSPEDLESAVCELFRLDWILIDVPCSNTGVLGRRPEARYRIDKKALRSLLAVQLGILEQASQLVRPKTRLMYSTCSLEREENGDLIDRFIASNPQWRLFADELILPSSGRSPIEWRDGGYWAALVRE